MLCPIVADEDYTNYKFTYANLVQKENNQGIKMTLKCDQSGFNMVSPKFKINDSITFQAQCIRAWDGNYYFQEISVKFSKPVEDSLTYIVNLTSDNLNIQKKFNISDNWQIFYNAARYRETTSEYDIDITVAQIDNSPGTSLAPLYDDEELTDFELRGEDGTIRVHRAVLAAASPVLRRMLCGTWKETAEGHVDVPGTDISTLQSFKKYIYLNILPDTGLEQLMLLASYYMMPELEQKCVKFFFKTLTAQNAMKANNKLALLLATLKHFENGNLPVEEPNDKKSDENR